MSTIQKVKLAFRKKGVTHTVNGEALTFYPASLNALFELKMIAKQLARAITTLMSTPKVTGFVSKEYTDAEGVAVQERSTIPASTDALRLVDEQRANAVSGAIEVLLNSENRYALGCFFMDSLTPPSERAKGLPEPEEVDEFMASIDIGTAASMIAGVSKANLGVFGPLEGMLTGAFTKAMDRLVSAKPDAEATEASQTSTSTETSISG